MANAMGTFFPSLPDLFTNQNGWIYSTIITIGFVTPLSLFRELSSLRYVCLMGFACNVFIVGVIVWEAFDSEVCNIQRNFEKAAYYKTEGIYLTLSTAIYSFNCHPNVLDVYSELQRRSLRRMSKVLIRLMSIAGVLYCIVGAFGYLTFLDRPEQFEDGNILVSDYKGHIMIKVCITALCIALIPALPLCVKPAKDSLLFIVKPELTEDPTWMHVTLTCFVCLSQLLVAILAKKLTTVINLSGGTASTLICFTFPCMFYIKVNKGPKTSVKQIMCRIILVASLAYMFLFLYKFQWQMW
eukprot:TRINITY_DN2653_c0_g2_i8.p1 TRINITY_DN2653_c0_g2~~TRINITY_DN2653_c0_g2_i8.p1  ORF type:complete len:298 (-),score=42.58 TRINITY_DN2653_c0_g2_i8:1726-2619(-)